MINKKIAELVDKYGAEIDKNDFRNFIHSVRRLLGRRFCELRY